MATNSVSTKPLPQTPVYRLVLKELLDRKHLSQREASQMTGLSKNAISILCGEPTQIKFKSINQICQGLHVTIEELFVPVE